LTNKTYCEHHIKTNRRESAHERGYTSKWRKLSKLYLKSHPLCTECNRHGKLTPATEVHHIIPIAHGGTGDFSNLMPLCKICHSKITGSYIKKYDYQNT
jgi:5-methylcytosine-specific restriction protein A